MTAGALALAAIAGLALFDEKKPKEPYRFQSDAVVRSESLPISIMYSSDWIQPDAEKLLEHLEHSLGNLMDVLQIGALPPTRIAFGFTLDPQTFETAELENADGLLVRANFQDLSKRQRDDLEAYIVRGVLDLVTRDRSRFEPKRWLHDGFSSWWADQGSNDAATAPDPVLIARASVATRYIAEFSTVVSQWNLLRERVGEPLAEALAYCGLKALEERAGREAVIDLARSILGRSAPKDVRETLYEWFHPMAAIFSESTGEDWNVFLTTWEDWIEARATLPSVADLLHKVPHLTGSFEVHPGEGAIRKIEGRFANGENGAATRTSCALLYRKLSPFDHEIQPKTLLREERDCSLNAGSLEIVGRYGPGERVFLALEFSSPPLGVAVRVASRRLVIE